MDDAELDFRAALQDAIQECKRIGYPPSGFVGMISSSSAFEAVRTLLAKTTPSDGFGTLWEKGRLDLTVEAMVLKPEWRSFFTASEIAIARKRLSDAKYQAPWDEHVEADSSAGSNEVESLLRELALADGDVPAGKRIRARLRTLGHYGGLRHDRSGQAALPPTLLPALNDAQSLLSRIQSVIGLPERNHEDVVKDFLLRLGYEPGVVIFQQGRIDVCILTKERKTAAVFEVKRTIAVESERTTARRQGMDYAGQTGAPIVVVTDGDRYEIYDRRRGSDYATMLCGAFQLTRFTDADGPILDLLRPARLLTS